MKYRSLVIFFFISLSWLPWLIFNKFLVLYKWFLDWMTCWLSFSQSTRRPRSTDGSYEDVTKDSISVLPALTFYILTATVCDLDFFPALSGVLDASRDYWAALVAAFFITWLRFISTIAAPPLEAIFNSFALTRFSLKSPSCLHSS